MAKIENHKYSIEEAFRECFYIVPDYQREYVWTEKEVNQLLEDINDEMDSSSGREYFIGTILVSPTNTKNHFEVIDGQQRLTTFFLLLCAMRNLFKNEHQEQLISGLISTSYTNSEGDTKTSLKLEPRYENASEIMEKLVKLNADPDATRNSIVADGIKSFGSLENLINAYDTIYRYLNVNYAETSKLKRYWGFLANNVVFIQISTDVSSALKIFETINERGVGLNPMDLLKNLLFTHVKTEEFTKLKDEWKKITKPLEKQKEKPLRFLRYFLMANYKIENKRSDYIVREDEIYDWFTNKGNAALCDYEKNPFVFVRRIIQNVEKFIGFSNGNGNDGKYNIHMDHLKKLCGGAFSLHYVLLLAASDLPKNLFDHFVMQLESFLFYYIFTKSPTKELERSFSLWADELREIAKESNETEQAKKYNIFLKERFEKSKTLKEDELTDYLRRYTLHSMQQYRTRYLLAKMTQYVDMAYKGLKVPGSLQEYTVLEIEHILPNTPSDALFQDFLIKNPGKDYNSYKNRLGNLTLLEKPINIVASNDFYERKKVEYKKCKYYLTSSIAQLTPVGNNSSITRINQKLDEFNEWDSVSIDKRQDNLVILAKDIWTIEEYKVPATIKG
jgi:uncharacterized protein with ParB-like and HNH nuclease domain